MRIKFTILTMVTLVALIGIHSQKLFGQDKDLQAVLKDQARRVKVIEKVKPSVVAVFARGGKGGGSGVLINQEGYALTNFHVVRPAGPLMKCGLPDGVLYDAVLVGWDKVGDVALIKLLPPKGAKNFEFPFAVMGDSDKVRAGQWSLAMGNPFLLATDFTPTVTFGLISGVHRYQYPAGTLLEYTDCIQIDTSINPGNSGGPLFNMDGELIGINGRGSFDKRGRVNSGVGYAISINQIKNFMGHLRGGLDVDHATLGALVTTQTGRDNLAQMLVTSILENSDVARRGLDLDDELVSFDGRIISSVNHYKNVLGLYPRGWRVPMEYRRGFKKKEILVRLMGVQRRVISDPNPKPKRKPIKIIRPGANQKPSPAAKYYKPKKGFVNYYFNNLEQTRLIEEFKKINGDYRKVGGSWMLHGSIRLKKLNASSPVKITISEEKDPATKDIEPIVMMQIDAYPYTLKPLKVKGQQVADLKKPAGSGGFLAALYMYHQFLTRGKEAFKNEYFYGGYAPVYPPTKEGFKPDRWVDRKIMAEVLNTRAGIYDAKWYFSLDDNFYAKKGMLVFLELRMTDNDDPCEVYFSDYRPVNGRLFPHRINVRYGDSHYGTITIKGTPRMAAAN